jgi:cell division protein FtsB
MLESLFQAIKDRLKVYSSYALLLVIVLLIVSLTRNITKTIDVQKRIEKKENEIQKLEDKNQELREELRILTSDEYTEKQLRNKLGLAKEGEYVIVLPDEEVLRNLIPEKEKEEETLPPPAWEKWLNLFLEP